MTTSPNRPSWLKLTAHVHEHNFNVEDDEGHRDQVVAHREATLGEVGAGRLDATLVVIGLGCGLLGGAQDRGGDQPPKARTRQLPT